MDRMQPRIVGFGLMAVLGVLGLTATPASASLLRPGAGRAYPDIAGDINGKVTYSYDPATQTGIFHVTNTPYLVAGGSSSSLEYLVAPNADTGIRSQEIKLLLDRNGQLLASDQNLYELYGTIVANGYTYSGLLLKGVPTAFGAQDLGGVGVTGADLFDVTVDITGGALADHFGSEAYIRIAPELASTFQGRFDEDFSAAKATSNTRTYNAPIPFPIPEPSALALIALGLSGTALSHHRRRRSR
ncbi:MAG: hypothetical protein KatS3mg108_3466 [Isosphaeraceae bacterium]|jgi:hypothetical protein|nr:MAG: hypothetical protein KatS3mg108_3466 [Isosphaeraceae bacterium]